MRLLCLQHDVGEYATQFNHQQAKLHHVRAIANAFEMRMCAREPRTAPAIRILCASQP